MFTLKELLITVTILGILLGIAIPSVVDFRRSTHISLMIFDAEQAGKSFHVADFYYADPSEGNHVAVESDRDETCVTVVSDDVSDYTVVWHSARGVSKGENVTCELAVDAAIPGESVTGGAPVNESTPLVEESVSYPSKRDCLERGHSGKVCKVNQAGLWKQFAAKS